MTAHSKKRLYGSSGVLLMSCRLNGPGCGVSAHAHRDLAQPRQRPRLHLRREAGVPGAARDSHRPSTFGLRRLERGRCRINSSYSTQVKAPRGLGSGSRAPRWSACSWRTRAAPIRRRVARSSPSSSRPCRSRWSTQRWSRSRARRTGRRGGRPATVAAVGPAELPPHPATRIPVARVARASMRARGERVTRCEWVLACTWSPFG